MGSILINSFTAPVGVTADIYAADANGNNQELLPGVFSQIGFTDNDGNFSPYPVLFDILATSTVVSLTADCSNGCVLTFQQVCLPSFPTPTPTDLPPCYFAAVYSLNGSGNVLTYEDCNGATTAYTSTSENLVYLCMPFQNIFNVDFSVDLDSGYDCYSVPDTSPLQWVGEPVPSLTPTPTTVTPTPTPTEALYDTQQIILNYSFDSVDSNRTMSVTIKNYAWASGTQLLYSGTNQTLSSYTFLNALIPQTIFANISGTSGTVVLTFPTTTPGAVDSISSFLVNAGTGNHTQTRTQYGITGYTSELGKLGLVEDLIMFSKVEGSIQELSGLTNLDKLEMTNGGFNGDIQYLPNSIYNLNLDGWNTVSGNIGDLPTNIGKCSLYGNNIVGGNLSGITTNNLWTGTTVVGKNLLVKGNNTITGDMSHLPNINFISILQNVSGDVSTAVINENNIRDSALILTGNTISGNLYFKSNHTAIYIAGANTIGGDISATNSISGLTRLCIAGLNVIGGNISGLKLPSQRMTIYGNNVITGNIGNITNLNNATITQFIIMQINNLTVTNTAGPSRDAAIVNSGNTISGNISSLQTLLSLTQFEIGGNNTLTGDLAALLPVIGSPQSFIITSPNNTINAANFNNSTPNCLPTLRLALVSNNTGNGLSQTQVDKLISYLLVKSQQNGNDPVTNYLNITGTGHSAPSATGQNNLTTLVSYQGWSNFSYLVN